MGILSWIIFGLLAGWLSRFLMPGNAPRGLIATMLLGIFGAIAGGFIGTQLGLGDVTGFDLRSLALAVLGGVAVLFLFGLLTKGRA